MEDTKAEHPLNERSGYETTSWSPVLYTRMAFLGWIFLTVRATAVSDLTNESGNYKRALCWLPYLYGLPVSSLIKVELL